MATCRLCGQMDLAFTEEIFRAVDCRGAPSDDWRDVEIWQLPGICWDCGSERFNEAYTLTFTKPGLERELPEARRYTERSYNVGSVWNK